MPVSVEIKVSPEARQVVASLNKLPRNMARQMIFAVAGVFGRMKQELAAQLSGNALKPRYGRFIADIETRFHANYEAGSIDASITLKGGTIVPEQGREWINIPYKGSGVRSPKPRNSFIVRGGQPKGKLGRGLRTDAAMIYRREGKTVRPVVLLKKEVKIPANKIPNKVFAKWTEIAKRYEGFFSNAVTRAAEKVATQLFGRIFK